MQSFSILLGLAGLASLAFAWPVDSKPDVTARSSWIFEYCQNTGLSGSCGQDTDDNANLCLNISPGTSVRVFDGFLCTVFSNADCYGLYTARGVGTWPDIGMIFNSYSCTRA